MAKGHSRRQEVTGLRRGDVYLVSFDPTIGHEIKKTRPALVIQNDVGNRYGALTIVAAITSTFPSVPHPVVVVLGAGKSNGLSVTSAIRLDQIRTVDRQRLVKRLGAVDLGTMRRVDEALSISVGLVDL